MASTDPLKLLGRNRRRQLLNLALVAGAVVALIAVAAVVIPRAQPPRSFTIVTGLQNSASYKAAQNYQRIARDNDFYVKIIPVEDSVRRLDMLLSGEAQVGFIPGGVATGLKTDELRTLASVYYEPLWIFYRRELSPDRTIDDLRQLRGLRVAFGPGNVGTERLARFLLDLNGLTDKDFEVVNPTRAEAVAGLKNGTLDVAFFNGSATNDAVLPLLQDPELELVNLRRASAYTTRYRFLTALTLPEGVISLKDNLPRGDRRLLSAVSNVVIRSDLHPDLIRLLTIAVVETHEPGGLFEEPYQFPNLKWADLPVSREYLAYLDQIQNGRSQLDNLFPFWLAALIDRIYIFALPVLLLLIPLFSRSPAVYGMFMRRKLHGWYQLLRDIEKRTAHMNAEQIKISEDALDEMERRLEEKFSISTGYLAGYYDLRMHIALVRGKLHQRRENMAAAEPSQAGDQPDLPLEPSLSPAAADPPPLLATTSAD